MGASLFSPTNIIDIKQPIILLKVHTLPLSHKRKLSLSEGICLPKVGRCWGLLGMPVKFSLLFLLKNRASLFVFLAVFPTMPVPEEMSGHLGKRMPIFFLKSCWEGSRSTPKFLWSTEHTNLIPCLCTIRLNQILKWLWGQGFSFPIHH